MNDNNIEMTKTNDVPIEVKVVEKKTFKQKVKSAKAKVDSFIEKNKDIIVPVLLFTGGAIVGSYMRAAYEDKKYGNKTIAYYDHYLAAENRPEIITFTRTPSIRDIKRGIYTTHQSSINSDPDEIEKALAEDGWLPY